MCVCVSLKYELQKRLKYELKKSFDIFARFHGFAIIT